MQTLSNRKRNGLLLLSVIVFSFLTGIITVTRVAADTDEDRYGNELKTYISYSYTYGGKAYAKATGARFGDLKLSLAGIGISLSLPVYKVDNMETTIKYRKGGRTYYVRKEYTGLRSSKKHSTTIPPGVTDVSVTSYVKYKFVAVYSLAGIVTLPKTTYMSIYDSK